ncbi:hypothetical protein HDU96_006975 [Phlyctochytrium bullatum]|nr:hypothetical protein HDU96_006975 [Phlyctochytrium bullatum]
MATTTALIALLTFLTASAIASPQSQDTPTSEQQPPATATPAPADPAEVGNCLSGTYEFKPDRVYVTAPGEVNASYPPMVPGIDWSGYDFTVDYGQASTELNFDSKGGVTLSTRKSDKSGSRVSSTRYLLYDRITLPIKPVTNRGVLTTFITMSHVKDEIDWELFTKTPSLAATSNVFYRGNHDDHSRGGEHSPETGTIEGWNEYTIDWTRSSIRWLINGKQVREYKRDDNPNAFPSTPSVVQVAVWSVDAPEVPQGTREWAGGPTEWGNAEVLTAAYGPMRVQCYDEADREVEMWPVVGNRNRTTATRTTRTTMTATTSSMSLVTVSFEPIKTFNPAAPRPGLAVSSTGVAGSGAATTLTTNDQLPKTGITAGSAGNTRASGAAAVVVAMMAVIAGLALWYSD